MTGVNDIRSAFLDFFKARDHEVVASSSLVPHNDPTLMFTNAGMVQFKSVFTGAETRDYSRAVTSQKCVRAGGKHNDLDNVGRTARHHTFFEMLGNFSFGDYFKEQAIQFAWELVTKEFALDNNRLLVTVYADDEEAFDLWKKIAGLSESRILRISTSDNFWSMGETGPCGPCSEIFYDHGDHLPGGPPGSPDEDGDRFIEIWNLVFMQYDQVTAKKREKLPKPSIDTGMGLERIAAVLQGTHDNYETDLMRALIGASADEANVDPDGPQKISHRVIADHLRSSSFLIADGVSPSNEGRGYVLRRIMRRAMRHAHMLGAKDPLIHKLVPTLVREMGQAFPELGRAQALITETLKLEETRFRKTLDRGLTLLDEATEGMGKGDELPGDVAFKLYDTYGFPLDLTEDALKTRSIRVDTEGFDAAMAKQKAEARKAWAGSGDAATEDIWYQLRDRVGATDFLGYHALEASGEILALVKLTEKSSKEVQQLRKGEKGAIISNQTPFYGESGGQVGDQGLMVLETGAKFRVTDTKKKLGDLFVHYGEVEKGPIKLGTEAELRVDEGRREATRANHSATHLLHEALREVLGEHVAQKGSLVEPQRLRFDFSHPKPMEADELERVEDIANQVITQNAEVTTRVMPVDDAIEQGALALFGEKYGDEVRVVSMGDHLLQGDRKEKPGKAFSVELCGGTHVGRTGDIGLVRIVSESAVAAGVRRIEALTAQNAREFLSAQDERVRRIAGILKTKPEDILPRITSLLEERKQLEKELGDAKRELALGGGGNGTAADIIREVAGIKFLARTLQGVPAKDLKGLVDDGKKQVGSGVVAMIGVTDEGKAGIVVGVTDDLTEEFNAVDLVRAGAEALGGKGGGGRPDLAQAGGPDGSGAEAALDAIAGKMAS